MPIDARIPLAAGGTPVQLQTPNQARAEFLTLRQLESAAADADVARRQTQGLNAAYSAAYHDGTVDPTLLGERLARSGQGSQIPAALKALSESRQQQTADSKSQLELSLQRLEQVQATMAAQLSDPDGLLDATIVRILQSKVRAGVLTEQQAADAMRDMPPQGPERRAWAIARALEAEKGRAILQQRIAMAPTTDNVELGDRVVPVQRDPLTGETTQGTPMAKGVSADSRYSAQQALLRQRESEAAQDRRSSATIAAAGVPVTYQTDGAGNIVALPSRMAANGGLPAPIPVLGADGKPMRGKIEALNDGQSKALLFGSRAREAHHILEELQTGGTTRRNALQAGIENIPLTGGLVGGMTEKLLGEEQQMLAQAKLDFMTAVLRRESGASISDGEFANANKQYFPQLGEPQAVIDQKRRNRELTTRGILQEVPAAQRNTLMAHVLNDADFEALEFGRHFIGPDGVERVKRRPVAR